MFYIFIGCLIIQITFFNFEIILKVWVPTIRGSSCNLIALSNVRSVEFHPKDKKLVTATDDKAIKLWSIETKRFLQSFLGHTNRVNCARYSPSGKTVASCSDDRTLKLFDGMLPLCLKIVELSIDFSIFNLAFN